MRDFKRKHPYPLEFSTFLPTFLQYKQTWSPNMILFIHWFALGKGRGGWPWLVSVDSWQAVKSNIYNTCECQRGGNTRVYRVVQNGVGFLKEKAHRKQLRNNFASLLNIKTSFQSLCGQIQPQVLVTLKMEGVKSWPPYHFRWIEIQRGQDKAIRKMRNSEWFIPAFLLFLSLLGLGIPSLSARRQLTFSILQLLTAVLHWAWLLAQ